ncbi:MAG: alkaline phosphatase [Planctomycetes bacterium]|nr:alkaline phosphatase [Planctomycetota bacterium]
MFRKKILVFLSVGFLLLAGCTSSELPKNTILFIGDGMGFEQVKAAGMYLNGQANVLGFEFLQYGGQVKTRSASSAITDSAAAGTSIATGVKVNNGVISLRIPGNEEKLLTTLEYFKAMDKKVGLVSTTFISHATPASFGAHVKSRGKYKDIVKDYLSNSKPHVLLGGAKHISRKDAEKAGYTVVTNRDELLKHDTKSNAPLSGQFGKDHLPYEADGLGKLPHLTDMTITAIKILENHDEGFFLMVEGGKIDHAGHSNDLKRNIYETIEFAKAVQAAVDWAAKRGDTLIVVTSDHETGGLKVIKNNGKGNLPDVIWSSKGHTGVNVPLYATGKNAERFKGTIDNTDIFRFITQPDIVPAAKKPALQTVVN